MTTKDNVQEMLRRGAEREGVSVEAYTEFIHATNEALTLALHQRWLAEVRAIIGI